MSGGGLASTSSNEQPTSSSLFSIILAQAHISFKRVPARKIRRFCWDLYFVTLRVRTGYLFDAFAVSGTAQRRAATLAEFLTSLHQAAPVFTDVVILHEPTSDQFFFVNFALLEERCAQTPDLGDHPEHLYDREQWPTCVRLLEVPTLVGFPTQTASVLRELCARGDNRAGLPRPIVLAIAQHLDITDAVPLGAVLLEYPVAYIPADADQTAFLTGVPLDVYDCVVTFRDALDRGATEDIDEHTLLKFSCPSSLADEDSTLLPTKLIQRVRERFEARLIAAGCQSTLTVRHTTETHDRVSL